MASWFGHTQTLTSISKSVTTVAGGIMSLEKNVACFMKKVIYYQKFFHRVSTSLPSEVCIAAELLFQKCYEYRDEIREELDSKVAYVADAGRWIIGMEDWNAKMEKRLLQMNELILLANSLLAEYALNGTIGACDSKEELVAYLQQFTSSIVLKYSEQKSKMEVMCEKYVDQEDGNIFESLVAQDDNENTESLNDEDRLNPFSQTYSNHKNNAASNAVLDSYNWMEESTLSRQDNVCSVEALGEFECLQKDCIPSYATFRKSPNKMSSELKEIDAQINAKKRESAIEQSSLLSMKDISVIDSKSICELDRENACNPFYACYDTQSGIREDKEAPVMHNTSDQTT